MFKSLKSFREDGDIEVVVTTTDDIEGEIEPEDAEVTDAVEECMKTLAVLETQYAEFEKTAFVECAITVQESGSLVLTEGTMSNFFAKIKKFFTDLWKRLKGLWAKFMTYFDQYAKSDNDFIKKYEKQLQGVDLKGFEYKGYTFTHLSEFDESIIKGLVSSIQNNDLAKLTSLNEDEETLDKIRGTIAGENSVDSKDFPEALFKHFRNGSDDKDTMAIKVSDVITALKGSKGVKSKAEKAIKSCEKFINEAIKIVNKEEKALAYSDETADARKLCLEKIKLLKSASSIITVYTNAYMQSLKSYMGQNKSIAASMLRHKVVKEGTSFRHEGISYFDTIDLK